MVSNLLGPCLGSSEQKGVLRSSQAHWGRGYLSPLLTPPPGEGKTSGHNSLSMVSQLTGLGCI